jgi:hypothetical protein
MTLVMMTAMPMTTTSDYGQLTNLSSPWVCMSVGRSEYGQLTNLSLLVCEC